MYSAVTRFLVPRDKLTLADHFAAGASCARRIQGVTALKQAAELSLRVISPEKPKFVR